MWMNSGNRSHAHSRALDALARRGLNYKGWQTDFDTAKEYHTNWPSMFDGHLKSMQRKQSISNGDQSHGNLKALDALARHGLNYEGWQTDFATTEEYHNWSRIFDGHLAGMKQKQRMSGQCNAAKVDAAVASLLPTLAVTSSEGDPLSRSQGRDCRSPLHSHSITVPVSRSESNLCSHSNQSKPKLSHKPNLKSEQ